MGIASTLCIAIGCYPQLVYQFLPFENSYQPYDLTHTLTQLQLLFFSALAFVWLNKQGLYPPELRSVNIDVEWFYRKALPKSAHVVVKIADNSWRAVQLGSKTLFAKFPSVDPESSADGGTLTRRIVTLFVLLVTATALLEMI